MFYMSLTRFLQIPFLTYKNRYSKIKFSLHATHKKTQHPKKKLKYIDSLGLENIKIVFIKSGAIFGQ